MRKSQPLAAALLVACIIPQAASAMPRDNVPIDLANLLPAQVVGGFKVESLYVDAAGRARGARFQHVRTGFRLDLLRIQSVPQAFILVNTPPTSDMGEPHTQEHLLLGKGKRGRAVANLDSMSLAESSAFTLQLRTCYHFNTAAGPEVFFTLLQERVDALLHPDYSDEEIRREVRNFGVVDDPVDHTLRLEEKGTVYNEMVSTYERPWQVVWKALDHLTYGPTHPAAYSSGGHPSALRELGPAAIRRFHASTHHLANMGMVASLPQEMPLEGTLVRLDTILTRLESDGGRTVAPFVSEPPLPPYAPAAPGSIALVSYPETNRQRPGPLQFRWPATLQLDAQEWVMLDLFVGAIAGDASSTLYKAFVDTSTRMVDIGATGVSSDVSELPGHPVTIAFSDVAAAKLNAADIAAIRQRMLDEIGRVASWPEGSEELAAFNDRVAAAIVEWRRYLSKMVDSPPGFGFRGVHGNWMEHLDRIDKTPGFRKSLIMSEQLQRAAELVARGKNPWRERVARWGLATVAPYAAAATPSPEMVASEDAARKQRAAAEAERLTREYQVSDVQQAIALYRRDYEAKTLELKEAERSDSGLRFVDDPPLGLDPELVYRVDRPAALPPLVVSSFHGMSSATIGLALRADVVPEEDLHLLSLLPALMTQVGVIENGVPVSHEEMAKRLRREILSLDAYFSTNHRTGRAELVLRASGNDEAESKRAIEWMQMVLTHSDWRVENLPRIRDVVDQTLARLRNTMQWPEETWVNNLADAYWRQSHPVLLATSSFLTQQHAALRLRWLLRDAGAAGGALRAFFDALDAAGARGDRADLATLLAALRGETGEAAALEAQQRAFASLPPPARKLALEAVDDLQQMLPALPDDSLAADWSYLCRRMRDDLLVAPAETLAALRRVARRLANRSGARMFLIAAPERPVVLDPQLRALAGELDPSPAATVTYSGRRIVDERIATRRPGVKPLFVGLVNPSTQGGVFLNSAPGASFADSDRELLLDFVASQLYSGGGAHSMFMKTWAAGLAYSNGLRISPGRGRLFYYAERCPDLSQTLTFVIEELKKAQLDPALTEYAIALSFRGLRSSATYEARGEAMAADLADGLSPEVVTRFHRAILEIRRMPGLAENLHRRMLRVYGQVLPGFGTKNAVDGGNFLVIGPEAQMVKYEAYLKQVEGVDTTLVRVYPRDFWMVAPQ